MAGLLGVLIISLFFIYAKLIRFVLEYNLKFFCWYKWGFWFCEIVYLPLMFNIAWLGNCKFYSQRQAITITNCNEDKIYPNVWPNVMMVILAVMFAIMLGYNMVLLYILEKNKISTEFHEY
jgi:hypothetical protein